MANKLRVGITGANGRIGTILRKNLVDYDLKLFIYDPPKTHNQFQVASADQNDLSKGSVFIDFSDAEKVKECFKDLDVVIHLAALVDVSPYGLDWKEMWKNNFEATYNVFRECINSKVKRIVFASTNHVQNGFTVKDPKRTESIVIEKLKGRPMELNDPPYPDSMYAVAKLFGEDIGKLCALHDGLECISLRIGWVLDANSDDPSVLKGDFAEDYMRAMYLSHRDCINFFKKSVEVRIKTEKSGNIPFMMSFVCSNNGKKVWNLKESIENMEYTPLDDAESFFK